VDKTPNIADRKPVVVTVEPGTYWWCACGLSKTQPYCDGSHKGSGFVPQEVVIAAKQTVAFCACKHTGGKPFCDGTHSKLPK
jgi:CDGSH iron-sulfur domain-containing protein 3